METAGQPADMLTRGERLGSYEVDRVIGRGGMGEVYLARHVRLGREVALKVLRTHLVTQPQLVERFFQEARTVNAINHEHIVEVHDFIEDRSVPGLPRVYLVMENLKGRTLGQALDVGPMRLRRALRILRQVCEALGAAHAVGVVHRDVKPDNIFLTERGGVRDYVKMLDFGVAKLDQKMGGATPQTLEGMVIGTPSYMSPEQASALGTDPRSDVYAVGTILYEILAGRVPFEGEHFVQLAMRVVSEAPPPLPERTPTGEPIPANLRALVLQCLEKDREKRPQTMAEVAAALGAALTELGPDPANAETPAPGELAPITRPARKRWVVPAAAGALIVAAAAVTLWKWPAAPPPEPTVAVAPVKVQPQPAPAPAAPVVVPAAATGDPAAKEAKPAGEGAKGEEKELNRDVVLDPYAD